MTIVESLEESDTSRERMGVVGKRKLGVGVRYQEGIDSPYVIQGYGGDHPRTLVFIMAWVNGS